MEKHETDLAYALLGFVEAAKLNGLATELRNEKLAKKASVGIYKNRDLIEKYTGSYDVLIPLLNHAEAAVRFNAAISLIDDHFDQAIATLHDLDDHCEMNIGISAATVLRMYGELDNCTTEATRERNPLRPKPRPRPIVRPDGEQT